MPDEEARLRIGPISLAATGPLYRQIVEGVKREVAAGRVPPGAPLPSLRALGEELLVSLITVKRAYEELEREGIIICRPGLGAFVAEKGDEGARRGHQEEAQRGLADAVEAGRRGGLSDRELIRLFREALEKNSNKEKKHEQ